MCVYEIRVYSTYIKTGKGVALVAVGRRKGG